MLAHQRSRDTLTSGSLFKAENNRIASVSLNLQTVTSTKSLLSAFDDKRYIVDDGQHTFLYGHKNIVDQTAISTDDSNDNAGAARSGPTDDDDLKNWMPTFFLRGKSFFEKNIVGEIFFRKKFFFDENFFGLPEFGFLEIFYDD